jgi:hypothetical protein
MTTDKFPSTAARTPESRPVTTRAVEPSLPRTSTAQPSTGYFVVRSSKAGTLRLTYDTNDVARQRANLAFNRGPTKVSTE